MKMTKIGIFKSYFSLIKEKITKPIVEVPQGKLKGKILVDINGKYFNSFQGIPYAKPPVGKLRFKAPVFPEPWTGILDATKEGSESIAKNMKTHRYSGSEDCLSLNVYTPELPYGGPLKPVMFWIHGGGFTSGSSKTEMYGPEFLISEDIVLVTINYRLGILGFLNLEDATLGVTGNTGLKDMVMALHWVQNNIKQFNGDPNNVTIFGESAGSAACNYLILSQSAKGLFHRAILQSGVTLSQPGYGSRNAMEIAQVLGSNAKSEKEVLTFLSSLPASKFEEAQELIPDHFIVDKHRPYGAVIETPNPEAFLSEDPLNLIQTGNYNKVPIIIGYTSREGMFFEIYQKFFGVKNVIFRAKDFETMIPSHYNIKKGTDLSKSIAKKIEDFYYGAYKSEKEDMINYDIINTDLFFARGTQVTIRALLKTLNQPMYFYRFNLDTSLNYFKTMRKLKRPGACHGDDLGYLFKSVLTPEIKKGSVEDMSMRKVIKLWTNFAKTGNPTSVKELGIDVDWPPVTADQFRCLDIDKKLTITSNPDKERMKFWDEIAEMEGVDSNL